MHAATKKSERETEKKMVLNRPKAFHFKQLHARNCNIYKIIIVFFFVCLIVFLVAHFKNLHAKKRKKNTLNS